MVVVVGGGVVDFFFVRGVGVTSKLDYFGGVIFKVYCFIENFVDILCVWCSLLYWTILGVSFLKVYCFISFHNEIKAFNFILSHIYFLSTGNCVHRWNLLQYTARFTVINPFKLIELSFLYR